MAVLYRFFLVPLCLLLLLGSHAACSRQQEEAKPVQKNIGWKEVAEQLKTLEKKRKDTLEAFKVKTEAKTQARSASNSKPAPIDNTYMRR